MLIPKPDRIVLTSKPKDANPNEKAKMRVLTVSVAAAIVALAGFTFYFWSISNVEEPAYAKVVEDRSFQIRDYPALVVAEVSRRGQRQDAVRQGFGPLAAYIFAKERSGERISMTAPVTQTPQGSDRSWIVRFVMPAGRSLDSLPEPVSGNVRLADMPARRTAVVTFSGVATDKLIEEQKARLRRWMAERGYTGTGKPTYAYYNPPWTPGFLRRNEVLIDIASDGASG